MRGEAVAGKIFINYRRGDDAGFTQALYQRLEDEFTAADLFMDVEGHIKPGDDFVEVLNRQVASADILLAIIGPRWGELLSARANDPDDFVAIEIKAALDKGKRVIPVLVGGAAMPKADSLPSNIQALARRNAVGLRPERFKADCQSLVTALKEQLAATEVERNARTATERAAAEAARRKAEEEVAGRAVQLESLGRAQAAQGLSPEQIVKAEELANWDFIKDSAEPQEFRDHLARFPKGVVERNARAKLEALLWQSIVKAAPDDINKGGRLASFLTEFPDGKFADEARAMRAGMAERAKQASEQLARLNAERNAWAEASRVNTAGALKDFLAKWPKGENAEAAKARIKELRGGPGRRRLLTGLAVVGGLFGVWGLVTNSANIADAIRPLPPFAEPDMVTVPAGEFMMGSDAGSDDEKPVHKVKIAKAFAVGRYEVTFDDWDHCVKDGGCNEKPSSRGWGRGKRPVIDVSWDDVTKDYLPWLTKKTGKTYRLLTEAEWEYAARAGTNGIWSFGDTEADLGGYAWFSGNSGSQTHPVGGKKPNAFGLYDMHGNVLEWVEDCYKDSYQGAPSDGSKVPEVSGCNRVVRGGSWYDRPWKLRSADRRFRYISDRKGFLGFRLARTL